MFDWLKIGRQKQESTALPPMPPLTTFRGWLRKHKPTVNNVWGEAVFRLAFPKFSPPDWTEEAKQEALARAVPGLDHVFFQPSQHRRWGGYELDRGCYNSVAIDRSGNDRGTLAAELNAYRDLGRQDVVITVTDAANFSGAAFDGPGIPKAIRDTKDSCIVVSILPASQLRDEYEQSVREHDPYPPWRSGQLSHLTDESIVHVMLMPEVEWSEIPDVVDLRLPETRESFFRIFRTGSDPKLHKELGAASYLRFEGDNISRFEEMLPEFIDPALGGTTEATEGITQVIGAYLRNSGAAGIVYPSARNDFGVEFLDGEMTGHMGWNFVDYRTSKPSVLAAHSIYMGPWRLNVLEGVHCEAPSTGKFRGSLVSRGVASANYELYESQYGEQRRGLLEKMRSGPPGGVLWGSTNLDELAKADRDTKS